MGFFSWSSGFPERPARRNSPSILERMREAAPVPDSLFVMGGLAADAGFLRIVADITGKRLTWVPDVDASYGGVLMALSNDGGWRRYGVSLRRASRPLPRRCPQREPDTSLASAKGSSAQSQRSKCQSVMYVEWEQPYFAGLDG